MGSTVVGLWSVSVFYSSLLMSLTENEGAGILSDMYRNSVRSMWPPSTSIKIIASVLRVLARLFGTIREPPDVTMIEDRKVERGLKSANLPSGFCIKPKQMYPFSNPRVSMTHV